MKTYLFDTINRYKRFSNDLDVKTTLCNKSWWLFNDSGVKSLYIFQESGNLIVTTNGVVIEGTWQYVDANKSIILNSNNSSLMFHPVFLDDIILTLMLDGTDKYAFFIDENNLNHFSPKSLSDLKRYFEQKEEHEKYLQELQQRALEVEKRKRKQEQQERYLQERAAMLRSEWETMTHIICFIILVILLIVGLCFNVFQRSPEFLIIYLLSFIVIPLFFALIYQPRKLRNWKKNHPDDPVNKYL